MPEIAEVARVVHFIRKHLVGHTLRKVTAYEDANVFGKAGTSAEQVEKALTGKKIVGAKQQGKYFWLEMGSPPHLLMHFSMAGWLHIKGIKTGYREAGRERDEGESWPPKYVKFLLETDDGQEAAFVDFRRFGRVRLVDCPADKMRQTSPLKENGPDPVVDKDKVTVEFLADLCAKKKVPIKVVLLDQGNISGIGNWVSDEIFYDAKIHPEQYCNTLRHDQIKQLHKSLHYVCGLACDVLADASKFPEHWLMQYRWGKGKKDAPQRLPNGMKIQHLTVGGRTSAIVPQVQKKTGAVAGDVGSGEDDAEEDEKPAKKAGGKKRKNEKAVDRDDEEEEEEQKPKPAKSARAAKEKKAVDGTASKKKGPKSLKKEGVEENPGRRRSTRLSAN